MISPVRTCHITDDVVINNITFLANFQNKDFVTRVATTRQMKVIGKTISSEIWWNRIKSAVLCTFGLGVLIVSQERRNSDGDKFILATLGTSLLGFATLRYLINNCLNSKRHHINTLSSYTDRYVSIMKKVNHELERWEHELKANDTNSGLCKYRIEHLQNILTNLPSIKQSYSGITKHLSKLNLSQLNVEEEFEILEERCLRVASAYQKAAETIVEKKEPHSTAA